MSPNQPKEGSAVDRLVSARELAAEWRCHPTTVARVLRRAGVQPVVFTPSRNGLKRWRLSDVERYLRQREQS